MPGPATTTLYDLARACLDSIVAHWPGDAVEDVPEVQFVSNGLIASDGCDLLATRIERTFSMEGDPTVEQMFTLGPGFTNRAAIVACTMLRCVPTIDSVGDEAIVPTPAELEASAMLVLVDAQAMFNALVIGQASGELGGCHTMTFDSWTPEGPEGGVGGGTLRVRLGVM